MYGGTIELPLVVRTRIATGCGYGGQHSMDPIGLYTLFAGWRILAPSDPFDFIPFGKARVTKEGEDLTVLTYSSITGRVEALFEKLDGQGVSMEIIDLRTVDLISLDYETVGASLKKNRNETPIEALVTIPAPAGGRSPF